MTPASLRQRLVAAMVLAQLLLAAGLVWAGIVFTRRQLRRAFDTGLQGRLLSVAALVRYPESGSALVFDATMVPPSRRRRHPDFYRVLNPKGALVADTFPPAIGLPAPAGGAARYWDFQFRGAPYRGLMLPRQPILDAEENLPGPPALLAVYYAAPELDVGAQVAAAGVAIGVTSLLLLALTSLLAAWAIGRELDPLRELARQAAAISARNWRFQPRPGAAATAELRPLVEALERMLARLHVAHQQQRAFLADAAHHLKTPVAILKSTLQSVLQRPREREEYCAAAEASLLDVERLEQLLQRMLRLARLEQYAEDERPRQLPLIDVGATCQAAVERVQPLAQARGVALRAAGLGEGDA
ncbi:MAG: sensor histidine kinase, partial [Terriglobales bacterium]